MKFTITFLALVVVATVSARVIEPRDVKSSLLAKGHELIKKADEAITKLQAAHKPVEALNIKVERHAVARLVADLEATTTDNAKIAKIEHDLARAEEKLKHMIAGVHVVFVKRDLKSTLLAKAAELEKKTEETIKKLESEKRVEEAKTLKTEEAVIKKLVADLTAATDAAAITMLEAQLKAAETKLNHELLVINREEAKKANLLKHAETLQKRADEMIKKLEAEKRTGEIEIIKKLEAAVKKLAADLTAATDATTITKLEGELKEADTKLQHEISKINTEERTKAYLLKRAEDLQKKAAEAIKILEAEKRTTEVEAIKKEEDNIKKLVAELTAATDETAIAKIEAELKTAESKLSSELLKITRDEAHKVYLLKKASELLKKAEELVAKLKAEKFDTEAAAVQKDADLVKKLSGDLQAATSLEAIKKIETELNEAEKRLAKDVRPHATRTTKKPTE